MAATRRTKAVRSPVISSAAVRSGVVLRLTPGAARTTMSYRHRSQGEGNGVTTTSEVDVAAVPIGLGFTPFEDRLDVIDQVAVHAELRGLAFVSVAEAM